MKQQIGASFFLEILRISTFFFRKINILKKIIEKIKMPENSKNEVEFRRNMYFLDLILAREARHEKLYNEAKANKTH